MEIVPSPWSIKELHVADDYFSHHRHIFHHLKLEFALAIPALNE